MRQSRLGIVVWTVCLLMSIGTGAFSAAVVEPAGLGLLENLAGEWVEMDSQGHPTTRVVSVLALTSGGTALREVLFPGTDHEMISMYHLDQGDLLLSHYCVLGHQVRYRARFENDKKIVFECAGGTNLKSENDRHMHRGTLTILDNDHIQTEWLQFENGVQNETVTFKLARKK
ncbi:MAG: hypothetical protein AB1898_01600 [Acidobacteriota bacterium]